MEVFAMICRSLDYHTHAHAHAQSNWAQSFWHVTRINLSFTVAELKPTNLAQTNRAPGNSYVQISP